MSRLGREIVGSLTSVTVFGLSHEHQRWDRDEHIQFRCDKRLFGMEDAIWRAAAARGLTYEEARQLLCEDKWAATEFGAPTTGYSKYRSSNDVTLTDLAAQSKAMGSIRK